MDSDTTEEASAAHLKHERRTSGDFKNGSSNEVNKYTHASIILLGTKFFLVFGKFLIFFPHVYVYDYTNYNLRSTYVVGK